MVEVLTVGEVADRLKVSPQLVYKQARNGTLPSFKVGDRVLFNAEKIEALISNGEDQDAVKEEPKQNNNVHRVSGAIRARRLASARLD